MNLDIATYADALEQTWDGVLSVCADLTPAQWDLPTDLPGWSVKDNVSHTVGMELLALGEPQPAHELPEGLAHVRHDAGRFVEVTVDVRRPVPGADVLAELKDVTQRRLAELRALPPSAIEADVEAFFGSIPMVHFLGIRTFDSWAHEQDVRRALGRPGNLSSPAAHISRGRLLRALARGLASEVPAAEGRSLRVTTTGDLPSVATLRFGDDWSVVEGGDDPFDVAVTLDFATFALLGTGRVTYDAVAGAVSLDGDKALGEQLLRNAAVTP